MDLHSDTWNTVSTIHIFASVKDKIVCYSFLSAFSSSQWILWLTIETLELKVALWRDTTGLELGEITHTWSAPSDI